MPKTSSTSRDQAIFVDQATRRQILILDSCFSGAFAHGAKGEADLGLQDRFLGQGRGRVVLTASTATEYSFEGDPTDAAAPVGSVFTAALVQGLRTGAADTDRDGHVSVDDAYAYVFDQVQAVGAAQTPQRWLYGAEGRILLARSPAAPVIIPAPLPESLQAGLDSPHPGIRVGAVTDLGEWLTSDNPGRVAAARRRLQEVADTDIPRVAHTALALLGTGTTAEPPVPAVSRTPVPAPPSPSFLARTLTGHTGMVRYVAFSPDGKLLATASDDGTARLWNPATGDCLRNLAGDGSMTVMGVAFSLDGKLLATAGLDGARLWNPATGDCLRTLSGPGSGLRARVAFSPDGRLLATTGFDGTPRLWNPATGDCLRTLTGHDMADLILGVAFSPDGQMLATGSSDHTARLWNPATGDCLRTLTDHTDQVLGVAFSPDGQLLATGGSDHTARLWNLATGDCLRTLTDHTEAVSAVAFSPDGRLLATASDHTAWLWS